MFCRHCGKEIDDGLKFCTYCGQPTAASQAGAAARPDQTQVFPADQQGGQSWTQPQSQQTQQLPRGTWVRQPDRKRPLDRATNNLNKRAATGEKWIAVFAIAVSLVIVGSVGVIAWQLELIDSDPFSWLPFVSDSSDDETDSTDNQSEREGESPTEGNIPVDPSDSGISGTPDGPIEPYNHYPDEPEGVTVRTSLSDYSWEELSLIATEIESCTRSSDALTIAQDYNLVDASGRYGNATKSFRMSDGKTIRMRLVGVWHDDANTPSGKAGLSFLSDGITYQHRMAPGTTMPGGWGSSEMRGWLQSSVMSMIPDEVSSAIIPVYKNTNNTGKTSNASSVNETSDTIWLPSIVELCGPVDWEYSSNPANSGFYNSVFNAEGTQYEAFAQSVIRTEDSNSIFSLGGEWWMRSSAASTGRGRNVGTNGDPSKFGDSNRNLGVVFGFCL